MIGPLGRLGAAANLRQHCPQITQRPGTSFLQKWTLSSMVYPMKNGIPQFLASNLSVFLWLIKIPANMTTDTIQSCWLQNFLHPFQSLGHHWLNSPLPTLLQVWRAIAFFFTQAGCANSTYSGPEFDEVSASRAWCQHCHKWFFLGGVCKPRTSIYGNVGITP